MNLIALCRDANAIGIAGHIKPDGDCIGSALSLWQFLKKVYPDKKIDVWLEKPAALYDFLPGVKEIVADGAETDYDLFFVLDSVAERIGAAKEYYDRAKKKVNIDHHVTNPGEGDEYYVDPEASSTSELIYRLIKKADPDGTFMDAALAETLYLGIIQDCGVFQYSNTSPETLRIGAELISYGFDFSKLIDTTFYEKSYVQNKLLGFALSNSKVGLDGEFIYSIVTREDMDRLGATDQDFEGIVNQLRYTRGVKAAALIHQTKDGKYKVSLRSSGEVDVSKVALSFGGGGHVRAAGCTLSGNGEEMADMLEKELKKQIK
ncbi:MAG: bifunctional oligoribonuclease/PAP phosphatase NrnA [Lachnospiraceae bacterium]|nr:bifunctional oligoribonuclease/PAP phosphatase NrnA [Lachnospiraceae bacterium]